MMLSLCKCEKDEFKENKEKGNEYKKSKFQHLTSIIFLTLWEFFSDIDAAMTAFICW